MFDFFPPRRLVISVILLSAQRLGVAWEEMIQDGSNTSMKYCTGMKKVLEPEESLHPPHPNVGAA